MLSYLKSIIPWQVKLILKIMLARLPVRYLTWSKLSLFKHGYMDIPEYVYNVTCHHIEQSQLNTNAENITVMEIGPGDTLLSSVVLHAKGISNTYLVDSDNYARKEPRLYFNMIRFLKERGYKLEELGDTQDVDVLLNRINAKYLCHGVESLSGIEDSSVDFIWSHAVLEHIRLADFDTLIKETFRILKPGRSCSHRVDLTDHLGGGLNNLRFSKKLWESDFFTKSGFYTNRIRCSEMIDRFMQAGFVVTSLKKDNWDELPVNIRNLDEKFRKYSSEELLTYGFDIVLVAEK